MGHFLGQFAEKNPALRPRGDASFMQDLTIAAERLKEDLSSVKSARYVMRFGGAVCHVELRRDELEKLTEELLNRTIAVTERTIAAARGQTSDPVRRCRSAGRRHDPDARRRPGAQRPARADRAAAPAGLRGGEGAALFALTRTIRPACDASSGLRSAGDVAAITGLTVPEVEEIARKRVTTVVSRGFGVMSLDGRDPLALTDPMRARKMIMHLLSANTTLPEDTGPFTFHTSIENQRAVAIEVWEQAGTVESEELADNRKIGQGILKIPPRLPAQSPVEVTFYMSETGLLTVRAVEPGSGKNLQFDLQIGDLDQAGMDKARQSVANYQVSGD